MTTLLCEDRLVQTDVGSHIHQTIALYRRLSSATLGQSAEVALQNIASTQKRRTDRWMARSRAGWRTQNSQREVRTSTARHIEMRCSVQPGLP